MINANVGILQYLESNRETRIWIAYRSLVPAKVFKLDQNSLSLWPGCNLTEETGFSRTNVTPQLLSLLFSTATFESKQH